MGRRAWIDIKLLTSNFTLYQKTPNGLAVRGFSFVAQGRKAVPGQGTQMAYAVTAEPLEKGGLRFLKSGRMKLQSVLLLLHNNES